MTMDETLLHAWLDDELGPERRAEVDAWLREHPDDAARVRLWAADRDVLRARFNAVLEEPVPDALTRTVWRGPRPVRWRKVAAALAQFALGGVVGAALMTRLPPGAATLMAGGQPAAGVASGADPSAAAPWLRRAAIAHAVYVPEVRHPVEVAVAGMPPDEQRAQEQHLSRWLTKRLTVPVKAFDLRAQGFELVGGRLLPDAAGPSAQLMYQAVPGTLDAAAGSSASHPSTASGASSPSSISAPTAASATSTPTTPPVRVTVYLRKPDKDTPAAFRYERQGELGLFYWVEGDSAHGGATGYALVGALPRERLLALAEAIYQQGRSAAR